MNSKNLVKEEKRKNANKIELLKTPELPERLLLEKGSELVKLWDQYAKAGYENIYLTHSMKELREEMEKLFLVGENGTYLDAGCGAGNMFGSIIKRICPQQLYALDWSKEMLDKAKVEAEKLKQISKTDFHFYLGNLSEPLNFSDNFFDGAVSNLVICYLAGGWKNPLKELRKVMKVGGYLYLSTFLKEWNFQNVLWRFGPREFFREPIRTLRSVKYLFIVANIYKEGKRMGAELPSRDELVSFLKTIGFGEIKVVSVYWEAGLVLRAKAI